MTISTAESIDTAQQQDACIPMRPTTLRDVLADCGGPLKVAKRLGVAPTTVYSWSYQGRVPDSDLKTADAGGTTYSDQLAEMQQTGSLTGSAIRRLGRRL